MSHFSINRTCKRFWSYQRKKEAPWKENTKQKFDLKAPAKSYIKNCDLLKASDAYTTARVFALQKLIHVRFQWAVRVFYLNCFEARIDSCQFRIIDKC